MKEATKGIAFTVVMLVLVVNFLIPRPIVPTLPHKSWDWLTPWPLQVVRAGEFEPYETMIKAAIAAALIREFLEALNRLVAESLYQIARDALERSAVPAAERERSPAGGGGGLILTDR